MVALYVGRIAPEKNLPLTLRAFETLLDALAASESRTTRRGLLDRLSFPVRRSSDH